MGIRLSKFNTFYLLFPLPGALFYSQQLDILSCLLSYFEVSVTVGSLKSQNHRRFVGIGVVLQVGSANKILKLREIISLPL